MREATNYIGPDFEDRKARKAKVVGLQSLDKARPPRNRGHSDEARNEALMVF